MLKQIAEMLNTIISRLANQDLTESQWEYEDFGEYINAYSDLQYFSTLNESDVINLLKGIRHDKTAYTVILTYDNDTDKPHATVIRRISPTNKIPKMDIIVFSGCLDRLT